MPPPSGAPQGTNEPRDLEQGTGTPPPGARAGSPNLNADDPTMMGRRPRSSIPSFFFLSFVLFMLTNNQSEELAARNQYLDALSVLDHQLSNFTAWRNGTASNFTLVSPSAGVSARCMRGIAKVSRSLRPTRQSLPCYPISLPSHPA